MLAHTRRLLVFLTFASVLRVHCQILSDTRWAQKTRIEKRCGCCNFANIVSIEPNFCRDIEHIILTNLFFSVFGIVTFWRENNVVNFAPKKLNTS